MQPGSNIVIFTHTEVEIIHKIIEKLTKCIAEGTSILHNAEELKVLYELKNVVKFYDGRQ